MPDYSRWKRRQLWTLVEAACLLSGIEPVPPAQFDGNRETGGIPAEIYADLKDAIDLKQIEFVKSRDGQIRGRRVKPDECVTWAAGHGYSVPDPLADLKKRNADETPQERAQRLADRIAREKGSGNRAFLKTVASEEGISTARLKQICGKQDLSTPKGKTTPRRAKPQW